MARPGHPLIATWAPAAAAACGVAAGVVLAINWWRRSAATSLPSSSSGGDERAVELSEPESSFAMTLTPSISSITFYSGSADAAERHLKERLTAVVSANPWLLGRLQRSRQTGRVVLRYNSSQKLTPEVLDVVFRGASSSEIFSDGLPYATLVRLAKPFCVAASGACINASGAALPSLYRVTVIRDPYQPRFAVCESLCHVVGDGHTFYSLHAMLSAGAPAPPPALIVDRPATLMDDTALLFCGHDSQRWLVSAGFTARIARAILWSPAPRPVHSPVHPEWVAEQKRAAASGGGGTVVSTNDILTSWLMREAGCCEGVMAVNVRGRIPAYSALHAGNYEFVVAYQRADFASPELIRASLGPPVEALHTLGGAAALETGAGVTTRVRRAHGDAPFPGLLSTAAGSTCLVTNWAGFYRDVAIPDATLLRHEPLFAAADSAAIDEFRVIFRPREGALEVLAMTRLGGEGGGAGLPSATPARGADS